MAELTEPTDLTDNIESSSGRPRYRTRVLAVEEGVLRPLDASGPPLRLDPDPAPEPAVAPPPPPPAAPRGVGGLRFFFGVVLGAVVGALVAGGLVIAFDDDPAPVEAAPAQVEATDGSPVVVSDSDAAVTPQVGLSELGRLDVKAVLEAVEPAVVSIEITTEGTGGAGTGFIISSDGNIVTNAHVVEDAQTITVHLADGRSLDAQLIEQDPTRDLAVLKVDATGLPTARLGSSAELEVGDEVLAIGNALNLGDSPTVTTGIVSALDREVRIDGNTLTRVIQTDAAINPGNSGGPLVNARGEVIGINSAIAGGAEGIGFAISIDHARPVIESLAQGVVPTRPLLGVHIGDLSVLDEADRQQLSVPDGVEEGAVVVELTPGAAAEAAGLEVGEIIVSFDGEPISDADDLVTAVRGSEPGRVVEVGVVGADGVQRVVSLELGSAVGAGG